MILTQCTRSLIRIIDKYDRNVKYLKIIMKEEFVKEGLCQTVFISLGLNTEEGDLCEIKCYSSFYRSFV